MPLDIDTLSSLALGLALAAACGLRVFLPLLVLSIAARAGIVPLTENFEWVASYPAMLALAAATVIEVAAYFIPWVDNALDVIATPAAMLAGVLAMASTAVDVDPALKWGLAIVAGGGAAGVVQGGTAVTRAASSATTAGLGNFAVSILELIGAAILSLLALVVPLLIAVVVLVLLLGLTVRLGKRLLRPRQS